MNIHTHVKERAMERVNIFCKSVIKTGSAFGVRTDTGEQVFLSPAVVRGSRLYEGEVVDVIVVPNAHRDATTEWFAIRVCRDEVSAPAPKPEPVLTIDDRALIAIRETDGYLTTAEMAELLNTDSTIAHNALLRLFNQGKIAKADVYGSGGQSRPSFCLWAASAKTFVGEDE
jgi:hypothetical protein